MRKVISVKSMMCKHCQAAVTNALKGILGVSDMSLEENCATITDTVVDDTLRDTIVAADFRVIRFQRDVSMLFNHWILCKDCMKYNLKKT